MLFQGWQQYWRLIKYQRWWWLWWNGEINVVMKISTIAVRLHNGWWVKNSLVRNNNCWIGEEISRTENSLANLIETHLAEEDVENFVSKVAKSFIGEIPYKLDFSISFISSYVSSTYNFSCCRFYMHRADESSTYSSIVSGVEISK